MEELDIAVLTTSDRGLRDGLLVDYLEKTDFGAHYAGLSVRASSVLQLGRRCGFDEPHAAQTARLVLELFDSARDAGLHTLGAPERELLGWAAQLHDIGAYLTYTNHHLHGYYFIRNADLLGFDTHEIDLLAALVRYHRKSLPRKRDPECAFFSASDLQTVRVLCVLLRLAESLDRSHAALVAHAAIRLPDDAHLTLEVISASDPSLELWSVRDHHPAVRKVFERSLVVTCRAE
jgi:exopolyphosphatase/guanosine-5'-triphosphate,3'-diphosphate pyrophosphatase